MMLIKGGDDSINHVPDHSARHEYRFSGDRRGVEAGYAALRIYPNFCIILTGASRDIRRRVRSETCPFNPYFAKVYQKANVVFVGATRRVAHFVGSEEKGASEVPLY